MKRPSIARLTCYTANIAILLGTLYLLFATFSITDGQRKRFQTIRGNISSAFSRQLNAVFGPESTTTTTNRTIKNTTITLKGRFPVAAKTGTWQQSIVCHTIHCGRLGNTLFEYASVLGIAWATGKTPFITNPKVLQGVLKNPPPFLLAFAQNPGLRKEMEARCQRAQKVSEGSSGGTFHADLLALKPGQDYQVNRCLQSWKYFREFFDEVREAVTFSDDIVHEASGAIEDLRSRFPNSTFVGIHVRRGDVISPRFVKKGWVLTTPEYFQRAMTYFRNWLGGRVTFVVVSQDPKWCSDNIASSHKDVVVLKPNSPAVDMQILSMTDHLIQSIGSFSWWSAFKVSGRPRVVYFKDWTLKKSPLDRWFSTRDYMLPDWLPM